MRHPDSGLFFYAIASAFKPFLEVYLFYRNENQKAKNRKMGCKNNQMYLFWTGDSHFVECSFWFWVNKFIPNGIRPADNNFVTPLPRRGDEIVVIPIFLVFMRVSGLFRADFSKLPHRGCPTPKRAKTAQNRLLVTAQEGGFFIF